MQDRRTVLKQIATGAAIITASSGGAAARGGGNDRRGGASGENRRGANAANRRGASVEKGIVATADELGFDTLIAAVKAADPVVLNTLTNDDQYTVFAPTEEAFEDFFATVEDATGLTATDLLDDPDNLLTDTLLFHVTGGRRYAASVVNAPQIDTLLGESFSVDGKTLDDRADITTANVEASNGVIHAIDAVLTTPTVDQVLEG
ncbi:fasciclin domain-containing protein [Halopenitus persicus]|uniref:fasciclin domain-containing protein n=1 Tax=Halopenitus persicus TaxID=1048396 RepID=UPI000BBA8C7C|nr:fasciclin domain-containing protein [Halopenitus persicus]